jgi:hypothetical protein
MNNLEQPKNLSELINEALHLRNLNMEKLSEMTDIPIHYLIALSNADLKRLPATPYVRGYLAKIAQTLRTDVEPFLRAYKQELSLKILKGSGPLDKLPSNRYAVKPFNKKIFIVGGIVLIAVAAFLIWGTGEFLGTPNIKITSPAADNIIINNSTIKLSGEASRQDKLTINNEEVLIEKSGRFEKDFSLQPGINTIEFKIKRFLGKEITVVRQVVYQP